MVHETQARRVISVSGFAHRIARIAARRSRDASNASAGHTPAPSQFSQRRSRRHPHGTRSSWLVIHGDTIPRRGTRVRVVAHRVRCASHDVACRLERVGRARTSTVAALRTSQSPGVCAALGRRRLVWFTRHTPATRYTCPGLSHTVSLGVAARRPRGSNASAGQHPRPSQFSATSQVAGIAHGTPVVDELVVRETAARTRLHVSGVVANRVARRLPHDVPAGSKEFGRTEPAAPSQFSATSQSPASATALGRRRLEVVQAGPRGVARVGSSHTVSLGSPQPCPRLERIWPGSTHPVAELAPRRTHRQSGRHMRLVRPGS
jgi:hypothetical protein